MSQENLLLLFPFNHVLSIVPPQELPFRNLARGKFLLSSAKRKRKSNTCTSIEKIDVFGSESEDQDYSDEERMSSSK